MRDIKKDESLDITIEGTLIKQSYKTILVNRDFDIETIGELINAAEIDTTSVHGRHVEIIIREKV